MSFRWSVPLNVDEMWLNSDREILGRAETSQGQQGIILTTTLPDGEQIGIEVDKLNAETGSSYCNIIRETFNERKASKEASSRRKFRDRQLDQAVVGSGEDNGGELEVGSLSVSETVEALQAPVSGATSLEEEIVHRYDRATGAAAKLRGMRDELDRDIQKIEKEIQQLETMMEVFRASKVLEQASTSVRDVREEGQGPNEGVDASPHSPEAIPEGGEGAERGGEEG
jgi:hypothetical protein